MATCKNNNLTIEVSLGRLYTTECKGVTLVWGCDLCSWKAGVYLADIPLTTDLLTAYIKDYQAQHANLPDAMFKNRF